LKSKGILKQADWLVTSVKDVTSSNLLYHKLFQKEFSAINPSENQMGENGHRPRIGLSVADKRKTGAIRRLNQIK